MRGGLSCLLQGVLPAAESELNLPAGRILQGCWATTGKHQETKTEGPAPRCRTPRHRHLKILGMVCSRATLLLTPAAPDHHLVERLEELHDALENQRSNLKSAEEEQKVLWILVHGVSL